MSTEHLDALVAAATADPAVAARFAGAADAEAIVAIAAELGYDVTTQEVTDAASERNTRDVSDAELAGVAGGNPYGAPPTGDPLECNWTKSMGPCT